MLHWLQFCIPLQHTEVTELIILLVIYCTVIFFLFCFIYSQMNFTGDSLSLPQPSFHTNLAYSVFLRDET